MNIKEIAWLAGLLEGEGWFGIRKERRGTPVIRFNMTDRDVIKKANDLMHGIFNGPYQRIDKRKSFYHSTVFGQRAIEILMTLYSFMGERRKEKFREIISDWKTNRPLVRKFRKNAECHPERRHEAKGLCTMCYQRKH